MEQGLFTVTERERVNDAFRYPFRDGYPSVAFSGKKDEIRSGGYGPAVVNLFQASRHRPVVEAFFPGYSPAEVDGFDLPSLGGIFLGERGKNVVKDVPFLLHVREGGTDEETYNRVTVRCQTLKGKEFVEGD